MSREHLRILFVSSEYGPRHLSGGIGTYVYQLAREVAKAGHEVHVLTCRDGQVPSDDQEGGIIVHRRELRRPRRLRKLMRFSQTHLRLCRAWTAYREMDGLGIAFDIIDAPNWEAEQLLIALNPKAIVITTLVTPLAIIWPQNGRRINLDARAADLLERIASSLSAQLLSDSAFHLNHLRRMHWLIGPLGQVCWLPLPDVEPASIAVQSSVDIVQVGRLEHRKRPEVTLEAVGLLRKNGYRARVVFVGRGGDNLNGEDYIQYLKRRAEELGVDVLIMGYVGEEDVRAAVSTALVVCQPSGYESFGLAAAEAVAAGTPIVVSDRCGIVEALAGCSVEFSVPVDDPEATAARLARYLDFPDAARSDGAILQSFAQAHLSAPIIARHRIHAYRSALASRHKTNVGALTQMTIRAVRTLLTVPSFGSQSEAVSLPFTGPHSGQPHSTFARPAESDARVSGSESVAPAADRKAR